jgi:hypothetical protein
VKRYGKYSRKERISTTTTIAAAAAAAATVVAIALKFRPKYVTNKNKTKHTMKRSHINVNIYDKAATFSPYYFKPQHLKSNITCMV